MVFWNRRQSDRDDGSIALLPAREPAGMDEGTSLLLDDTLETLAAVLRPLGREGLDVGDHDPLALAREYERWASHVPVAAPPPGEEAAGASRGGRRDWGGVRRFVRKQRLAEQQVVSTAVNDLRAVIWASVETLQNALSARELGARISALGSQLQEARRESAIDPLTQLFNRRAFDEYLARIAGLHELFGQPALLLMLDADHFKRLNDKYGHPVGDKVLQALADCLARCFLRKVDMVARYGGEEFAVILPETDAKNGRMLAERALHAVRVLQFGAGGATLQVTISIGVAGIRRFDTPADWIESADRALYAAKEAGRNPVAEG